MMEVALYWHYPEDGQNAEMLREEWGEAGVDVWPELGEAGEAWPELNRQIEQWKQLGNRAIRVLVEEVEDGVHGSILSEPGIIEVSLLDDREIARVHEDFMQDATPTDVITFQHGEILVSLDTAVRQAGAFGVESWKDEVARYIVHGLCHLHGYNDLNPVEREAMHELQESVLARVSEG